MRYMYSLGNRPNAARTSSSWGLKPRDRLPSNPKLASPSCGSHIRSKGCRVPLQARGARPAALARLTATLTATAAVRGCPLQAAARAGRPSPIRWHDFRHMCAPLLLGHSVHLKLVQHLLRQTSITLHRYSHWIPSIGRHAAERMDEAHGSEAAYRRVQCIPGAGLAGRIDVLGKSVKHV